MNYFKFPPQNIYKMFIKLKILIHTCMIVIRIGSLCVLLAYVSESYTYESPAVMNDIHTIIGHIDFLCVRQSYAYDAKTHSFTSPSDVHANHTLGIRRKRFTLEVYKYH